MVLLFGDSVLARRVGQLRARRRLAAAVDQESRERQPVAVGVERLAAIAQQRRHPLEVVEQPELPGRVIPFA
jgi:hypothetical protein